MTSSSSSSFLSPSCALVKSDAHLYTICILFVPAGCTENVPFVSASRDCGWMEVIFRLWEKTVGLGDSSEGVLSRTRCLRLQSRGEERRRRGLWTLRTNTKIGSSCLPATVLRELNWGSCVVETGELEDSVEGETEKKSSSHSWK